MHDASRPIRVLVVDDSASIRAAFARIINAEDGLEVMASVGDPYQAADKMRMALPDAILLDLELPRMDGLTFLKKIMAQRPLPVVVCSSYTDSGSEAAMAALDSGAAEVIAKPRLDTTEARREAAIRIGDALRAAVAAGRKGRATAPPLSPGEKLNADVILPPLPVRPVPPTIPVTAIGASTGGTEALQTVLSALPPDAPPVVIVQHMPENFTAAFARRLDTLCRIDVREARDGDSVRAGLALIAPGNQHLVLRRSGGSYRVGVLQGPYVSRHRPSVDVLFRSAAQQAGANALGVILTGMGDDGAAGMAEMKAAGARTLAQDEATCVVYGMPREAVLRGGVDRIVPLDAVAPEVGGWGMHGLRRPA
ncbi:chemotaxis response regulator protein-glutamate methylesterase [Acuticoccus sp. M5D2P5]|uniref:protein-glutamate methylesterase/protein-glutamine glutaminase n=1 Tax=Acuticoccus kalidii TaxID=2910977 RepID=UPI001F37265E|nr:chemotaxis response regulator protein-glutamate methylesterase [Acuticoccus kalidii]MCF3932959.1 chemotaxis response regulator protein-glutamate methylesterase [Acuticoccus kalidii]